MGFAWRVHEDDLAGIACECINVVAILRDRAPLSVPEGQRRVWQFGLGAENVHTMRLSDRDKALAAAENATTLLREH